MSAFTETITEQLQFAQWAATKNLEEMTHGDSIVRPTGGGNDFNWVLGHVISGRNRILPAFGEQPFWDSERTQAYAMASSEDTAQRAPLDELRQALATSLDRVMAGLGRADDALLDGKAPFSPANNPNETLRSLLMKMVVHESYHIGQLGALRRAAGKQGAIVRR
ncbi:MAG TPA: DinB family protein [Thermoanaerobaculia bacterium]|nr:DinB family protein [Thermoanaerobaculia bacterium]